MSSLRSWATPLTVGSFLIMGATGVLMFFHIETGLNGFIHEWAGWAMVAGVGAHLAMNWRAFKIYFKRPLAKGIMGVSAVVLLASFVPVSSGGSPVQVVMQAIGQADVETVIALSGQELETGLARLADAGFSTQADTRVQELTGGDRGQQMQIIEVLFSE
ncbi:DUF4405 domain-containing protein [Aliisedimentitalea scapharcae]|uniref:DUF4405 domain-containing protein n=1 Tax=Aliisedimentitalea scapharcae TaxID=1524259 RepID=A0ABZ2XXR3_9RHOB